MVFFFDFLRGAVGVFSGFFFLLLLLPLPLFVLKLTPVAKLVGVIGAEVPVAPDVELIGNKKRRGR